MSALERILRELESATEVVAAPGADFAVVREAMDRRQRVIADLAELATSPHNFPAEECEDALRRLRRASEAGVMAEQWLVGVKNDAVAEWNQWSHIYRALGAARDSKPALVDCRG